MISKNSEDSTDILYSCIANNRLDKNLNPISNKITTDLEKLSFVISNANNDAINTDEVELIGNKFT